MTIIILGNCYFITLMKLQQILYRDAIVSLELTIYKQDASVVIKNRMQVMDKFLETPCKLQNDFHLSVINNV